MTVGTMQKGKIQVMENNDPYTTKTFEFEGQVNAVTMIADLNLIQVWTKPVVKKEIEVVEG